MNFTWKKQQVPVYQLSSLVYQLASIQCISCHHYSVSAGINTVVQS